MCDVALSLTHSSGAETDMKSWEKTRDPAVPTDWQGSEWRIMRSASLHNQISGFWSVSQSVRLSNPLEFFSSPSSFSSN